MINKGLVSFNRQVPYFLTKLGINMKSRFHSNAIVIDYAEQLHVMDSAVAHGPYYVINSERNMDLPEFGWKIHISAVPQCAVTTLVNVMRSLTNTNLEFKFIQNSDLLQKTLHKSWPRENSGKFITIYPHSENEFLEILNRLNKLNWPELFPYILSDRQYKNLPIFYRYGRIKPKHGNKILGPGGVVFLDDPKPYFELPDWITDPVYSEELQINDDFRDRYLHGRYDVREIVHVSNTGNIYRAIDRFDSKDVIIKETRPNMVLVSSYDELYFRNQEFNLIKELNDGASNSNVVPATIETFKVWKHTYHVFECIKNTPLYEYDGNFRKLWGMMTNTLRLIHDHGIAIGDVSPNNLVINDQAQYGISVIDLETGTSLKHVSFASAMLRTKGYKLTEVVAQNKVRLLMDMQSSDREGLALTYIALVQPTGELFDFVNSSPEIGISLIRELLGTKIANEVAEYLQVSLDEENSKIRNFLYAIENGNVFYDFDSDFPQKVDLKRYVELPINCINDISILRQVFYRVAMTAIQGDDGKYYIFATYGESNAQIREFIEEFQKKYIRGEISLW